MERPQASRGLTAMALLSLMVVAGADRALLASRPGSPGALHAVAITTANYWVTNGNGTFTYSAYSPIATPNTAYIAASGAAGLVASVTGTGTGIYNYKGSGLNSIAFPSKNLGIAVGAALSATATSASIMLTIDGGLTWMAATGLPEVAISAASVAAPAYPAVTAGDLQKVWCASKSACWAVGGNLAAVETLVDVTAVPPDTYAAVATYPGPSTAVVYMSTNGGSVWASVPTFYSKAAVTAANAASNTAALNALYATVIPGGLYSISGDSAGKNLYAVGAPGSTFTAGAATYSVQVVPTIMYSGNSGATWALQTAPALAGGITYTLFDVAVLKGTTAYAVGGTMGPGNGAGTGGPSFGCAAGYGSNGGCNGQIVMTNNGGFSWSQAKFPGNSGANVPALTSVALNGPSVWVGGFVRQDKHYPTTGSATVTGQSYTVLVSFDGVTFSPAAASYATFPPGFILSGLVDVPTTAFTAATNAANAAYAPAVNDVLGIFWDNNVRGYIYGNGYILGTQDAGKTWTYETPNTIVTAKGDSSNVAWVYAMSNVPTSY